MLLFSSKVKGIPPDEFYCWQMLEKTGSYMMPGRAFNMNGSDNHYYFRLDNRKKQLSTCSLIHLTYIYPHIHVGISSFFHPSLPLCPSVRLCPPSICLSVRPSICQSVSLCPSVSPSVLSVCLSVRLLVHPTIRLSVRPSVCPSVRSLIRPSVRLSVCSSVRPSSSSVGLSVCPSVRWQSLSVWPTRFENGVPWFACPFIHYPFYLYFIVSSFHY